MAMFGQNSSKWGDALMNIGALMTDVGQGQGPQYTMALAKQRKDRQLLEQQMAARQQLSGLFGGTAMGSGQGPGPNIRDPRVQQALLNAEAAGVDVDTALKLIEMSRPNVQFAPDETAVDVNDPANVGKSFASSRYENGWRVTPNDANAPSFLPKIPDATIPDGRGGVIPVAGAAEAMARQAGMIAGAEAAGKAPYDFINVPTASGAPRVMSKSNAMGGDFVGQSPAQREREISLARGDADRANAIEQKAAVAASQLSTLDNMERLLPDVISGFGADARLNAARAMALAGNEDAKRKVAATETYLNEARNLVSDIIKSFGANPTEGERKYAERMSGADANLNPETLKEGIRLRRERINRDLANAGRPRKPQISREQALEELRRRGLVK